MKLKLFISLSLLYAISLRPLMANVSVPAIFGDHMVIQQKSEITLWGWAKPMEKVFITTSWSSDTIKTEGNNQANWSATIKTPGAGGPHFIKIQGYNALQINDILVGEVWLVSGQSNMEWSARMGINNAEEAVKNATQKEIRFFSVTHRTASNPNYDVDGHWVVCSPETMIDFSAIGYFYAKNLNEKLKVPVGIINASWGGTPIEVWIPEKNILNNQKLFEASKAINEMSWSPREPGRVFNAMLAPIMPFKIAGVLWYQGETNTANAETYTEMLQTLIESWRKGFQTDFPFYYAQIAPWNNYGSYAGAKLREAQRRALFIPKTGMVVVSDIGDTIDIHPRNKTDVGKRFANLALNQCYGFTEYPVSGPLFSGFRVDGQKVTVDFKYADGLHFKGKFLADFEVSGSDGIWYPAKAIIKDNTVIVSSSKVKIPVNVRLAWSSTASSNLFNSSGLPSSCFTSLTKF
jgi:sialate O-acetylesterase